MPTDQRDPQRLDRRASNAQVIAASRAAIARGCRLVDTSEQLMKMSARLMPRSPLEAPPRQMPSEQERRAAADNVAGRQANLARRETEALRQIGHSLRSYVQEIIASSQEIRWQASQTRMQAREQRARAQQVCSRTRHTAAEATYRVIVDGLSGYGVEVKRPHQFQSVRGFHTQSDAIRWIADQKAASARSTSTYHEPEMTSRAG